MDVFAGLPLELRHRIYAMAMDDYVLEAIKEWKPGHRKACYVVAVKTGVEPLYLRRGLARHPALGMEGLINTGDWRRCSDGDHFEVLADPEDQDGPGYHHRVAPTDGSRLYGVLERYDPDGPDGSLVRRRKVVTSASAASWDYGMHEATASMILTLSRMHRADM